MELPEANELASLNVPVLGLYGGDDERVVSTVEPASVEIKKLGKVYEYEIYDGAGHGFLRQQSGREGANLQASEKAWSGCLVFLQSIYKLEQLIASPQKKVKPQISQICFKKICGPYFKLQRNCALII